MTVFEDNISLLNDLNFSAISFKFPWYNIDNEIIGLIGCSIACKEYTISWLVNSLSALINTGLL